MYYYMVATLKCILSFNFRLTPILEPDMVAKKLLEGILINQKMIFVPSSLNIFLFMEK